MTDFPPIPPIARRGGRPTKYHFAGLAVGQPMDVARCGTVDAKGCRTQRNVSICGIKWAKRNAPGRRFTVRVIDDATVRVWRIA